ncbi:serine/threonine-protein kinase VRK3-like [Melanerpes formicivorus]|uniref:serine/threonine-protein kinase VRK3-like n=1 Tax=Melanerpes formicivorus TaxID=211600 RepID=UPI00358FE91B
MRGRGRRSRGRPGPAGAAAAAAEQQQQAVPEQAVPEAACASPRVNRFCPQCGSGVEPTFRFCPACGQRLPLPPPPPPEEDPEQPAPAPPQPQPQPLAVSPRASPRASPARPSGAAGPSCRSPRKARPGPVVPLPAETVLTDQSGRQWRLLRLLEQGGCGLLYEGARGSRAGGRREGRGWLRAAVRRCPGVPGRGGRRAGDWLRAAVRRCPGVPGRGGQGLAAGCCTKVPGGPGQGLAASCCTKVPGGPGQGLAASCCTKVPGGPGQGLAAVRRCPGVPGRGWLLYEGARGSRAGDWLLAAVRRSLPAWLILCSVFFLPWLWAAGEGAAQLLAGCWRSLGGSAKLSSCVPSQLDCLEYIHDNEYVHGDLTADNIYLNPADLAQVTLAGYSSAFRYCPGGRHVAQRQGSRTPHEGTLEFISLDSHRGAGPSRRSDLESLGYCLLKWLCGSLPWSDELDKVQTVVEKKEKYRKDVRGLLQLCFRQRAIPDALQGYLQQVMALEYEEKPDYEALRQHFRKALERMKASAYDSLDLKMVP